MTTLLLFSDDGASMFVAFGFFSRCAQAWDVRSSRMRWNAYVPGRVSPQAKGVVGPRGFVFNGADTELTTVDVATGKVRSLISEPEHHLSPLLALDDIVIVTAAPRWDSALVSLWGLDAVTGARRWQFALSSRQEGVSKTWSLHPTSKGLAVLQSVNDDHIAVDLLDPRTGASSGQHVLAIGSHGRTPRVEFLDDVAWIVGSGELHGVSPSKGTFVAQMP